MGLDIEEKDTAHFINDFFVNIGPNLAKTVTSRGDSMAMIVPRI